MRPITLAAVLALTIPALAASPALAEPAAVTQGQPLPTGQSLTPLAAPGASFAPLVAHAGPHPEFVADGAAATAVSPDGREMHRRDAQASEKDASALGKDLGAALKAAASRGIFGTP